MTGSACLALLSTSNCSSHTTPTQLRPGLGLPQRYLIRAAPELPNPLMFDNDYYAQSVML